MSNKSKKIRLDGNEARSVFAGLSERYRIVAPINKPGCGRLSDTDLITYDEIKNLDQIDFSDQASFSAKHLLFPIRETMFTFRDKKTSEPKEDALPVIVVLRSCDIHAMEVIDEHFLRGGGMSDTYYEKRRGKIKFFLMECCESFDNCYCVSLGTNRTDNYSAFIRKSNEHYEFLIKDKDMEGYFPARNDNVEDPKFVKENKRSVDIPEQIDISLFEDDMWKEYSLRCIACGRCNTSCPTCTCFSVQDIPSDRDNAIDRRRIWSSCHVKEFSLLAGGHNFRNVYGDRMRYRTLHKISDFKKRTGRQMCVGCGRCDDVCPVYISMFGCIDKITAVTGKKKSDG